MQLRENDETCKNGSQWQGLMNYTYRIIFDKGRKEKIIGKKPE